MAYDDALPKGTTSKILEVHMRDSGTGQGKTGIAFGSVTAYYCREGSTATSISAITGTVGDAYSSGKWAEVSSANMPGLYQFHIPNAAFADGADAVTLVIVVSGATDKAIRFLLTDYNPWRDSADQGTGQSGATSTTFKLRASASSTDSIYNYGRIVIVAGTGVGQTRLITGYVGSTKVCSISPAWVTTPDTTSVYVVIPGIEYLVITDMFLDRDMSSVSESGATTRTPLNSLRFLRNKWSIASTTLTVKKEDDSTDAWTAAVTSAAGNPITSIDPT